MDVQAEHVEAQRRKLVEDAENERLFREFLENETREHNNKTKIQQQQQQKPFQCLLCNEAFEFTDVFFLDPVWNWSFRVNSR